MITAAAWKTIEKDDFAKTCKIFKKVSLAQFPLRVWRTKQEQIFPASKLGSLEDKERAISDELLKGQGEQEAKESLPGSPSEN